MKNNENRAAEIVKYNGKMCRVLRIWDGDWYDLETVQETEKGITEQYLSVDGNEIRAQADIKLKHSGLPICSVRQCALHWWNNLGGLSKTRLCDINTDIVGHARRHETLTGYEIQKLYDSEHVA